ncbi:hypothetical protein WA538_003550 [Blastocystis sp. DL]
MSAEYQDWTPYSWDKTHNKPSSPLERRVNIARRFNRPVVTTLKYDAGKNKSDLTMDHIHLHKVEDEEEVFTVPKVGLSFRLNLQKARQSKNMTQKDLAAKLNVKTSVIQDYESGKVVPNNALISRMERILGMKLRNSNQH